PDFTEEFETVASAERDWVARRRAAAGVPESDKTTGLALSGGGIRSATFCLGVLQTLSNRRALNDVDYLSSVSGGGYIASCLTWIRSQTSGRNDRQPFDAPVRSTGESVVDWLRAHGKYLVAERGFTGWTLGASILAATLLNLLVMLPPLLLLIGIAALDVLPVDWPAWASIGFGAPIRAHDGFALALWLAVATLALYPIAVLSFAVLAGIRNSSRASVARVRRWMGFLLNSGIGMLCVGLVPLFVSIEEALVARFGGEWLQILIKAGIVSAHLLSGVYVLGRTERKRQKTGRQSRGAATLGLALILYGCLLAGYHLVVDTGALGSGWVMLAASLSLVLAFTCELNRVSMHSYYRARLTDAFLPDIDAGSNQEHDAYTFRVADVSPDQGAPFPIINTTVSVNDSGQQKRRARGAASFFLSPLFCGSAATGFRTTRSYRHGRTSLSTAATISGAAVDPNTEVTRARPVAFLMALLNFRLGFWAHNPRFESRRLPLPWWYIFIGREMLGRGLSENRRHVHLTDGGHFDNLGFYELVRRQCRHIIVCDAGADPDLSLSDLGLVTQRVRADFGADIVLPVDHLVQQARLELSEAPFALGQVRYANGSVGDLLYIKPMMRQGLGADIYTYWKTHPEFPNQSTANQFFDEQQFNAYRELGRQIMAGIIGDAPVDSLEALFERAKRQVVSDQPEDTEGKPLMSVVTDDPPSVTAARD
ncbi:MAG: patatin-like phospholipase family protein, partial [Pseudomonadota bacterium]